MNHVVQYTGLEQWLECPPIHDVTRTVEDLVDVELHSGVLKDADWLVLVELLQHINIAFRAFFAPCHLPEHCGMRHSKPPQLGLVGAECFQYVLEVQSHRPRRVYQTIAALCRRTGMKTG